MLNCILCLLSTLSCCLSVYPSVSMVNVIINHTSKSSDKLKTSLQIWRRFTNVCSNQVLQIGIQAFFKDGQKCITDPVDLATLAGQFDGWRLGTIQLRCSYGLWFGYFQRIFVKSLGDIFLAIEIN